MTVGILTVAAHLISLSLFLIDANWLAAGWVVSSAIWCANSYLRERYIDLIQDSK